tara:strand:+ start:3531 stop:4997 length:1467 start_codon:yes stop_codon:yes gene_type:complete
MKMKNLFVPFIFGIIGIFSFAPFSLKLLIFISYAYLIYVILYEEKFIFTKIFSWGVGHWGLGMSWIIVSVYYYGETTIAISLLIYTLLVIILTLVFTSPLILIRIVLNKISLNKNLYVILITSSFLIVAELSRYFLLNGVPWLIPGNIYLDTLTQNIYPLFGVTSTSYLLYILSSYLAISYHKKIRIFLPLVLIVCSIVPNYKQALIPEDGLEISIIQPSSDPFLKYKNGYQNTIEENLINLIASSSEESEIIVLPEAELPYSIKSINFNKFINKVEYRDKLIMGIWDIEANSIYNSVYSLKSKDSYKKIHLVPFGEYIPFITSLRGLISFFDLPMSNVTNGPINQQNIQIINNVSISTPICFDIAFANTVRKMNKSSFLMVNISNDTWFGNSIGPYHHLSIARIRSIENNRWTIRSTNDGISAIIDNNGTIVDKLDKGISGILEGRVKLIKDNSFYNKHGYLLSYIISFIIVFISILSYLWKKFFAN